MTERNYHVCITRTIVATNETNVRISMTPITCKPKGLAGKGTSSSAGAAAATVVASQVQPCSGQDVSRTHAPHQAEGGKFGVNSSESEKQPRAVQPSEGETFTKGVFNKAKRACREFLKSQPQKPNPRLKVPRVGMFEKAVKVFSAIAACVSPVVPEVNQEFLLDTGAGRNLISFRTMPRTCHRCT